MIYMYIRVGYRDVIEKSELILAERPGSDWSTCEEVQIFDIVFLFELMGRCRGRVISFARALFSVSDVNPSL